MPVQIGAPTIRGGSANTVGNTLADWSQRLASQTAQKAMQRAQVEGQSVEIGEDEQGRPVMPEQRTGFLGGLIGGKTAEQYNRGVRDSYLVAIDRDNTEEMSRIALESDGDLSRFEDVAGKYRSSTLGNVDPAARDDIRNSLDSMISRARVKVQGQGIQRQIQFDKQNRQGAAATYADEASSLAHGGDSEGAAENMAKLRATFDSMIQSGDMSKAVADEQFDKQARRVIAHEFKGDLYRLAEEDTTEAFRQIDELQHKRPDMFSPEEWDSVIGEMMTGVNEVATINAAKVADLTIKEKAEISNLDIGSRTGLGDPDHIMTRTNELFFEGKITAEKRTSMITNVLNRQKQAKQKAVDYSAVARRLEGDDSVVLDKKSINGFYDEKLMPLIDQMAASGESPEGIKANFVERMKFMPESMKAEVSTFLNSDNLELITSASTLIDKVDEIEGITDQFGKHERAFASVTVDLMANMAPREAVLKARELTDPSNQARVTARTETIKQLIKDRDIDYRDEVESNFEGWFSSVEVGEDNADQLSKEYQDLFEAHYKAGMSLEGAKNKATQLLGRNWGSWNDRVMKHPPDKYYTVAGSSDYVQKELKSFVAENTIGQPFNEVILVSDEVTDRTASQGRPAYRIMLNTDDGIIPVVAGKTGVGHWFPDMDAEVQRLNKGNKAAFEERRKRTPGAKAIESNLMAF